jgi:NAD-dependent deacetylase
MDKQLKQAASLMKSAKKVIALTGAGVSTESGIPDFRSSDGLWSRYDPAEYGTISAFQKDPAKVWEMLAEMFAVVGQAQPNAGHRALVTLEKSNLLKGIITQNIDGLHAQAGSSNVVAFHGAVDTLTCIDCRVQLPISRFDERHFPPKCPQCRSILKPDIVFFDERIPAQAIQESEDLIRGADCLLVVGTSCSVVPAALIPSRVHGNGGKIIEINQEPALKGLSTCFLGGGFSEIMQTLVRECVETG